MKPGSDALRTTFSFGKEMDVLFFTTTKINVPASKTILPIRVNTAAGQGRYLLCFQIDHCTSGGSNRKSEIVRRSTNEKREVETKLRYKRI